MRYMDVDTAKKISKIGLGTWQFGSGEWGYGEAYAQRTAGAIVRRALELGVTLFDTAEIYGSGRSERILGQALREARDSAFLATKIFPVVPSALAVRHRAVASANRLGVSSLDLYQVHWPHPLLRDNAIMRGMRSLRRAGLVGEVGVSNYSLKRWRAAQDALGGRILTNQVEYSLMNRLPEQNLLPFAQSHGHVIIAFSPLARGLLSGRYHTANRPVNSARTTSPLLRTENLERSTDLIAALREVADAHCATPAQIALAWVIHHPAVAAIPGAASVEQLESNVAATEIELADDEYQALHSASARFCPTTALGTYPRRNLTALRHTLRCGRLVAKTAWHDYQLAHVSPGDAS